MNYGIFARVYNELMDDAVFYDWQGYTQNYVKPGASILELGCGNGQLGILLKKAGYLIEGLDLSSEMLAIAQQKQMETGIEFPLFQADMRDLSAFGSYEAIISFCDTLCYLPEKADMETVFSEVYDHLASEGVFLFDVFTTEHMANLPGYAYHDEIDKTVFTWDSYAGEQAHSVEHDLSFFIHQGENRYERAVELHKERTYPMEEYLAMLKAAGFSQIEVLADFDQAVTHDNKRWFFKAQK